MVTEWATKVWASLSSATMLRWVALVPSSILVLLAVWLIIVGGLSPVIGLLVGAIIAVAVGALVAIRLSSGQTVGPASVEQTVGPASTKRHPYVVCVEPRVVLFGFATEEEIRKPDPTLTDAQMCVYWDPETRGVTGLASIGPQAGSRVSPKVPVIHVRTKVEAVMRTTPNAVKRWQAEPWG